MRAGARIAVGVALGLAVLFGAAPPALADSAPDLQVSATFNQASYHLGDSVTVTVDVVNVGDANATDVDIPLPLSTAKGLDIGTATPANIASIAANGGTGQFTITGTVNQDGVDAGHIDIAGTVAEAEVDAHDGDNGFSGTKTVVTATSSVSGKFFDSADPSHGVAGATIVLTNKADTDKKFPGTSDGTGAFTIADVPTGIYRITITAPRGWAIHGTPLDTTSMPTDKSLEFALDQVAAPVATASAGTTTTATTTTTHAAATLANTGTPIRWIAGGGAAVVVAGAVLLLLAGRRRETTEISEISQTPSS
jgi:hypothetical protein